MIVRITRFLLKGAWWFALLLLLLATLYLSVGRLLTLSLSNFQGQIEAALADSGLQFVDLGTISGAWQVHDPLFHLEGLTYKPEDDVILQVDYLSLRLDSLRSLFKRKPVVSEIVLSGVRFTLQRDDQRIWVKGFETGAGQLDVDMLLDNFANLDGLEVDGIDVAFEGPEISLDFKSVPGNPWRIKRAEQLNHVHIPLMVERQGAADQLFTEELNVSGTYHGDIRRADFQAELFLSLPGLSLEEFLPMITVAEAKVSSAILATDLWLRLGPDAVDITGEVSLADVALNNGSQLFDKLSSQFRFRGPTLSTGTLQVPELSVIEGDFEFSLRNLRVALDLDSDTVFGVTLDTLDVAEVVGLLRFAADKSLVSSGLSDALASVSPAGELQDVLVMAGTGSASPRLVAWLDQFRMDAFLGVPSITPLNGFLSAQQDQGYLDLDNDNFVMSFNDLFAEPWVFDSGRGRIAYRVGHDDVRISSGLIQLTDGPLQAHGKLSINLPTDQSRHTWALTIGVQDADLPAAQRFLPTTIPADLRDWVAGAVGQGTGLTNGVTIHGALPRQAPGIQKSHDIFLGVEDTAIRYHPDWPVIDNIAGTIHVNSYFIGASELQGTVYNSILSGADVFIPITGLNQVDRVLVTGAATGPLDDALTALRETPLADLTSDMAATWAGAGEIESLINLNVPLGERADLPVQVDASFVLGGNTLEMPAFDLRMDELKGALRYTNQDGLVSDGFSGRLFDRAVSGRIESTLKGAGGEIVVHLDGAIATADLYRWSDQVLLSRASGELSYAAALHVPFGGDRDEIYVEAVSDLVGTTVDLPAPLTKLDSNEAKAFTYRQVFQDDGYRVEMTLDEALRAALKIEEGILTGGRIHFGEAPFGAVTYDAIRMSGDLAFLAYEDWQALTEDLSQRTDVSLEDEIAEHVDSVVLDVEQLEVYDLVLEDAELFMSREQDRWQVFISNDMLDGEVLVSDDESAPLEISLNRLSFTSDGETADPLGDINPLDIVDANFSTKQLLVDEEDFGSWSFKFRTDETAARLIDLEATALGVRIQPESELEWQVIDGQHETQFQGLVQIEDLAETLRRFGYASSIEGKDIALRADAGWPGSPAMVDVDELVGRVDLLGGSGRFVQAETGGALKLLGIFDFASLARRFRFDFSDVVEEGFEFSEVTGGTLFDQGLISVADPIVITSSSGRFTVGGNVNMNTRALDNDMVVTLPVGRTLPWYAAYSAIATGPLAGAGVMLAQRVFESQIDQFSSARYQIRGTIEAPEIEFVSIFSDKVRDSQSQEAPPTTTPTPAAEEQINE